MIVILRTTVLTAPHRPERKARAFLRWVGGKRLLTSTLLRFLPPDAASTPYHEPFAGAASLFFRLEPLRATLSDLNSHLIECYRHVVRDPSQVSRYLRLHALAHSPQYYYTVRDAYNRSSFSLSQAARFIYLNSTCFNGVFRVNKSGEFNVPVGRRRSTQLPLRPELAAAGRALGRAELLVGDFAETLACAKSGHFVYLDPPYPPLNGTSFFTHYTPDRFDASNQQRLAEVVRRLDRNGCLIMMTNADTPAVRSLYAGFRQYALRVPRHVSCRSIRHSVDELVITNYTPQGF